MEEGRKLCLFDIDGTLTPARLPMENPMKECLEQLRTIENVDVAIVGGSDAKKAIEQLGQEFFDQMLYAFSENGLVAYKYGKIFQTMSIKEVMGEDKLQKLINFCLKYIADLDIPIKRGTFIEYRTGMINISPIGRNCSQQERNEFAIYDAELNIRKKFVEILEKEFGDYGLKFSIGGQISFDVFPIGWDKTYCLRFLEEYKEIHFYGDKISPGGNDYELYADKRTFGHSVTNPTDTIKQLHELFKF